MNSPGVKPRDMRGSGHLSISIPNSMSYRNAPAPQLSPTDDELKTPKKQHYYRPPGSPESPEVPQPFFNYNHDRIQNDLLDEICDEIGIKDATDLDFMDFEPPSLDDSFNPGDVGEEIDNLDQLIMFGQIDPQQAQGQRSQPQQPPSDVAEKWSSDVDQSVPECTSMPNNSPVYGNSPSRPGFPHGPERQVLKGCPSDGSGSGYNTGDIPQSPRSQKATSWQHTHPESRQDDSSPYSYDETHSSRAHMTDDYKISSPRKNSTEGHLTALPQSSQGGSHHDSMLKMAIAQDRMLGGRAASPSLDTASPVNQMPPSPGYRAPSSPSAPGKSAGHSQPKVNQTDSSKGLDQFAAPENLPPGKERAMSRMKLVDGPGSGKRSPFDGGYFSVGSGGSHYEDNDPSSATPPHCPDQPHAVEDKMLDFLTDQKPLTDDALLCLAQTRAKSEPDSQTGATSQPGCARPQQPPHLQQLPNQAMASQNRMGNVRQGGDLNQPPRSPNLGRREIHRAVLPKPSAATKPGIFQRQNSNNQGVTFETPQVSYHGPTTVDPTQPVTSQSQGQGYPPQGQGQGAYGGPASRQAMAASVNCAPYPRSCRAEDMSYGAKRSGSNPSSPKKQRRLTYNPYQGDSPVSINDPGQYSNPAMAGRPVGGQYGQQPSVTGCQMGGSTPLPPTQSISGQPGSRQLVGQQQGSYGGQSQPNVPSQMVPGAHGAGPMPLSSQGGYVQGQYGQHRHNQYNQGQVHLGHEGQGQYSQAQTVQGQNHMMPNSGYQQQTNSGYKQQPNSNYQQQMNNSYQQPSNSYQQSNSSYQQPSNSYQQPSNSYQQQSQHQSQMSYGSSGPNQTVQQPAMSQPVVAVDGQQSLSTLIANHPEASRYGFMQHLISDRSNAFRSHPLFPLLRDLIVADMNFSTPTFPFQLIANLPADFDKLLSNFFQRNPPTTKYEMNHAVENVVVDALRYAHKALIEKITERKQKQGIVDQPKMFSAIEDFCERFDQAVKHTMSRNTTPKPAPPNQPLQMAPPPQQSQYHQVAPPTSANGPHGTMAPSGVEVPHAHQGSLRSMSPFGGSDHQVGRQVSFPPSSGWGPGGRSFGPAGSMSSSLPSTPTKGTTRPAYPHHHNHNHGQAGSATSLNFSDVELNRGHLGEQQKLGYGAGSMPNFLNSSGVSGRLAASTPPLRSPGPDMQRAGSEPALNNMKGYASPQRETMYAKESRNNNNNNNNNSTGTRKQVLPKEAVAIMLDWLREHRDNPYPNDDEKYMLIQQTKLTMAQINYWFTNARRRILPKWTLQRLMEEQARATGRELTPEQQKEILSSKLTPQAVRNILEGQSMKKTVSDISYGHIMNSVINQS